jgi:mono/diheme cytochrome c family protein
MRETEQATRGGPDTHSTAGPAGGRSPAYPPTHLLTLHPWGAERYASASICVGKTVRFLLGCSIVVVVACSTPQAAITALGDTVRIAVPPTRSRPLPRLRAPPHPLREASRAIVEAHCGECHRRDLAAGNPYAGTALEVFDLAEPQWAARLAKEQLPTLEARLEGQGAPVADVETVRSYVASRVGCLDGSLPGFSAG